MGNGQRIAPCGQSQRNSSAQQASINKQCNDKDSTKPFGDWQTDGVTADDNVDLLSTALEASSLVMRPSLPVPLTFAGSISPSLNILAAAGEG